MTRLDRIDATDSDGKLRAVIETPQGSRFKLAFEPDEEIFRIATTLPAGMSFPFDFGFIPQTLAQDGDPLDVLILMDGPAPAGCTIPIRLLGVIEADQREDGRTVRNDRLIALGEGSTERGALHDLSDLDPALLKQVETFFETYNRLGGKTFRVRGHRGPRRARKIVDQAMTKA